MNSKRKKTPLSFENLAEYFKDLVEKEIDRQKTHVSAEVSFYLVNLLTHFFKTEKLYTKDTEGNFVEIPLALILSKALNADTGEKIQLFKKLGDHSLYVSGFFSESIHHKAIDMDYYVNMGENAYNELSYLMKAIKHNEALALIYHELSQKFIKLTDVLAEVREASRITSNKDLLKMYEHWIATKSQRIEKKLIKEGIIPITSADEKKVH